jgi:hypothetical protein
MKIVAINIFKVNNFQLLITISLAKYVILRKQVFNQIFGVTLMQSMLNIYKRKDQKDLGIVYNTKLYLYTIHNKLLNICKKKHVFLYEDSINKTK